MANTLTRGDRGISILFDGATAWDSTTAFPKGLRIESIEFCCVATGDICIIREESASGRKIMDEESATAYDNKIKYFNTERGRKMYKLYVVGNEITAACRLIIEFA